MPTRRPTPSSSSSSSFSFPRFSFLALVLLQSSLPFTKAVDHKNRPFSRLQATTGATTNQQQPQADPTILPSGGFSSGLGTDEPIKPSEKVAFLRRVAKGDVDPIELFTRGVGSKGFQVVLKNVEIQHRILEEMPLLAAFDGFKQITGRRLSDEQTAEGFAQGVKNVLAFAKDAFVKVKDPTQTAATIAKMAADPDPKIQDMFRRAQAGDKEAVYGLQDVFNKLHFPGVDVSVLREVSEKHTFDKLLGMPEVMRFIDRDETLSKLFRSDIKETFFNPNFGAEFAAAAGTGAGENASKEEATATEAVTP